MHASGVEACLQLEELNHRPIPQSCCDILQHASRDETRSEIMPTSCTGDLPCEDEWHLSFQTDTLFSLVLLDKGFPRVVSSRPGCACISGVPSLRCSARDLQSCPHTSRSVQLFMLSISHAVDFWGFSPTMQCVLRHHKGKRET